GGNDAASYTAPHWSVLRGVPQVLVFDAVGIAGHAADSGTELWKFPWTNGPKVNAAQPIVVDGSEGLVFFGSGYSIGSAVVKVSSSNDNWKADLVWASKKLKLKFNCAILKDDAIYGLDEGILTCLSVSDGKPLWKGGRFGYGQLLLVGDVLLIQAES